jgi:hypothetical protein
MYRLIDEFEDFGSERRHAYTVQGLAKHWGQPARKVLELIDGERGVLRMEAISSVEKWPKQGPDVVMPHRRTFIPEDVAERIFVRQFGGPRRLGPGRIPVKK